MPAVLAAYRASPHESTGFTPNRLFLGKEVRMPLDLLLDLPEDERAMSLSVNDFVRQQQERTADAFALAREHLRMAAERRKASYDLKVKDVVFQVGDWVTGCGTGTPENIPRNLQNGSGVTLVLTLSCVR